MALKLQSLSSNQAFELLEGTTLIVGRAAASDIPVFDATISRRHAELQCRPTDVVVRDIGSSNGTFVNGARITDATVRDGDVIAFGTVAFRVVASNNRPATATPKPRVDDAEPTAGVGTQRVRRPDHPSRLLATVFRSRLSEVTRPTASDSSTERKLALLLDVSKRLSHAPDVDALLDTIARQVFDTMDVDRVAIELIDASGQRVPKLARDRHGPLTGRTVPTSIARTVLEERAAVLSDNAMEDDRFGSESVVRQRVRSAMCAPLAGSDQRIHGVLYVDNLTATHRFADDDLDFLLAFSSIAGAAIENGILAERGRRDALIRGNFERFFAPSLAERIAAAPSEVGAGGDKRTVAVLFSDIRGFTALSESMVPDDVARLLNEYFSVMAEVVFRHGGTLDKFIGDAVMAEWGAPIGSPDDANRALAAALDMQRELEVLNAGWQSESRPTLQIGIGLNYGESFAGFIGSDRRLEYTVIGDTVNVASRLCARAGVGEILLTESFRAALTSPPPMVEGGTVELRGKTRAIPVYRLAS